MHRCSSLYEVYRWIPTFVWDFTFSHHQHLFLQTFPETTLSQFINMMLDAMKKAAFHVKAEVCQALVLVHTQFSIPIPTDVKLTLLQLLNEDPLPRLVLPDEKQVENQPITQQ
jgi:hypothetical protein